MAGEHAGDIERAADERPGLWRRLIGATPPRRVSLASVESLGIALDDTLYRCTVEIVRYDDGAPHRWAAIQCRFYGIVVFESPGVPMPGTPYGPRVVMKKATVPAHNVREALEQVRDRIVKQRLALGGPGWAPPDDDPDAP